MPADYEPETPESIDAALEANRRERAAFTLETGIPLSAQGRLQMERSKKKPDGRTSGSTDTFVR